MNKLIAIVALLTGFTFTSYAQTTTVEQQAAQNNNLKKVTPEKKATEVPTTDKAVFQQAASQLGTVQPTTPVAKTTPQQQQNPEVISEKQEVVQPAVITDIDKSQTAPVKKQPK